MSLAPGVILPCYGPDAVKKWCQQTGVDIIKVGPTVLIIEIALSICALRQRPTFEKHFSGIVVQRKAQKLSLGCKTVLKSTPDQLIQLGMVNGGIS